MEITASPPARMIVGQRFELRCAQENTSTSVINIIWSDSSGTLSSTTDMDAEVLTLDPVAGEDAGNYTCSIEYSTNTLRGTYEFTPMPGKLIQGAQYILPHVQRTLCTPQSTAHYAHNTFSPPRAYS